ncbi:MAG TPA: hypothetical protein VHP58_07055 [Alphaproteobacteria bacterium]|nr:hypothetical protein [Alphaproteobacteria bacterium]
MKRLVFLLLLLLPGLAPAAAQQLPTAREFLPFVCAMENIRGTDCKVAKDYPNQATGEVCNLSVASSGLIGGRFISSAENLVLVPYGSDCEPRATGFGGAMLFEKQQRGYAFKGYYPGITTGGGECRVVAGGPRLRDKLICLTSFMQGGYAEMSVAQMVFTQDFGNRMFITVDPLITASSSEGALGTERVECKRKYWFTAFDRLRAGPDAQSVVLDVAMVPPDVIKRYCGIGVVEMTTRESITKTFTLDIESRRFR